MSWQDLVAGARMQVDQEFSNRVAESEFSRQQWGLIMTAVEFDVTDADDPDRARIVADTSKVEHVIPELDAIEDSMGAGGGGGGGGRSRGGGGGDGIVTGIKSFFGMGGGGDGERRAAAEALAQEYATELQAHLESNGRWEEVREAAASE